MSLSGWLHWRRVDLWTNRQVLHIEYFMENARARCLRTICLIGCIIFLTCENKAFTILSGRIFVFKCEKHRLLLWLARTHLHVKIYGIPFQWLYDCISQYVYNKSKLLGYFFFTGILLELKKCKIEQVDRAFQQCICFNPVSLNIHKQILQTDLYAFPLRSSWENLIKDQGIFSLGSFYQFS